VTAPKPQDDGVEDRSAFIHQETVKLATLIALAIAAFFVTRAIGASNRNMTERDAAEWYASGERALSDGDSSRALEAFRHASVMKRGDRQYTLALGRALAAARQNDAAERALVGLRESSPEVRK